MRQVVLHPGEDGYWVAECPSLPGCISQGETKETAIANIREAITEYIAALEDDGLPVPKGTIVRLYKNLSLSSLPRQIVTGD